jgi:hypothetical protein
MAKVLGRSFFFAVLLASSWPARAADPLLMFLFSVARELVSALPAPQQPRPDTIETPETYPGTTVEPAILRRLIDDSFLYLSSSQRSEIFEALHAELMKPANSAARGPMIEHFAHRALQVRAAHMQLAKLSYREKELLADGLRDEAKLLAAEDLGQLRQALERGVLPVPTDLNRLLLAALP